ncbi:MAG: hypothetical protein JWM11_5112 [Planctomycetaceae bacterium]|nr:hypothetical protein [Planctomycetaceae bacterium]
MLCFQHFIIVRTSERLRKIKASSRSTFAPSLPPAKTSFGFGALQVDTSGAFVAGTIRNRGFDQLDEPCLTQTDHLRPFVKINSILLSAHLRFIGRQYNRF